MSCHKAYTSTMRTASRSFSDFSPAFMVGPECDENTLQYTTRGHSRRAQCRRPVVASQRYAPQTPPDMIDVPLIDRSALGTCCGAMPVRSPYLRYCRARDWRTTRTRQTTLGSIATSSPNQVGLRASRHYQPVQQAPAGCDRPELVSHGPSPIRGKNGDILDIEILLDPASPTVLRNPSKYDCLAVGLRSMHGLRSWTRRVRRLANVLSWLDPGNLLARSLEFCVAPTPSPFPVYALRKCR